MSRPSQTDSVYFQTLPNGKCLCPDFRAFKIFRAFIVRSKVLMSRLSCVQNSPCPDFRAFQRKIRALKNDNLCGHVQTIVRSKGLMSRLSCVQKRLCPDFFVFQSYICPDYRAFKIAYVQTIVRSKLHMSRLSCVQNCLCPDYRAFKIAYVQTIVRSKLHMSRLSCVHLFSRPCNFERTTPPFAFILVWTYRLSVWDLNLGTFLALLLEIIANKSFLLLMHS